MKKFNEWLKDKGETINEDELSYKERKKLPKKDFIFPKERKYPIPDRSHAINALARVEQHGTPEEKAKVKRAVCKKYPDLPSCKEKKG